MALFGPSVREARLFKRNAAGSASSDFTATR
jgi:hypothetical protein